MLFLYKRNLRANLPYEDSLQWVSFPDDDDDEESLVGTEGYPDYPPLASNISLQEDSNVSDDSAGESDESVDDDEYINLFGNVDEQSNALTSGWTLPVPSNQCPIVDTDSIHPAEESLLCLLIENNLPKRMYTAIMQWANDARFDEYDFSDPRSYQTVLSQMTKKYANHSGGPPTSEIVRVPNYAPVHVYCFDFINQVTHLLSDPNLMSDALWEYNPQLHRETGE